MTVVESTGARDRYVLLWDRLDRDRRKELLHDRADEIVGLAEAEGDDRDDAAEQWIAELRLVAVDIERMERALRERRDDRDVLMIGLALLGVPQSQIAQEAEVTAMIVSRAIGTSTRK